MGFVMQGADLGTPGEEAVGLIEETYRVAFRKADSRPGIGRISCIEADCMLPWALGSHHLLE